MLSSIETIQVISLAPVYFRRNVRYLDIIHFCNKHREGNGQSRTQDVHGRVKFFLPHHGESLFKVPHSYSLFTFNFSFPLYLLMSLTTTCSPKSKPLSTSM